MVRRSRARADGTRGRDGRSSDCESDRLAVAVGLTWATNAIGGGTVVFSLVVALVAVVVGWRCRAELAGVLWVGFTPAVVVLVGELLLS